MTIQSLLITLLARLHCVSLCPERTQFEAKLSREPLPPGTILHQLVGLLVGLVGYLLASVLTSIIADLLSCGQHAALQRAYDVSLEKPHVSFYALFANTIVSQSQRLPRWQEKISCGQLGLPGRYSILTLSPRSFTRSKSQQSAMWTVAFRKCTSVSAITCSTSTIPVQFQVFRHLASSDRFDNHGSPDLQAPCSADLWPAPQQVCRRPPASKVEV